MTMISRLAAVALLVGSLVAVSFGVAVDSRPAAAQETLPLPVAISGRGWGHGRGLGQYGAQGYATDHAWTSAQILDHFYGGTAAGQIPADAPVNPAAVRVDLRSQQGQSLRVSLASGTILVRSTDGVDRWAHSGSVRLSVVGSGIRLETSAGCDGPWAEAFTTTEYSALDLVAAPSAGGSDGLMRVCYADGSSTWYPGYLRFSSAPVRTVNIVTIEEYLRGVVPSEVPAGWHPAALQAQAVAARSYAMAGDGRQQPYADTCDTILCQVYGGYFRHTAARGMVSTVAPTTDAAVAATAGLVRLAGASIARTEFSSSTGGYTAGGAFPAVADMGDATASNPNRTWSAIVDLRPFITAQGKGELIGVDVARTGLGPDGGRATSVTFRFGGGSTTMTGDAARRAFGLKSDWFTFGPIPVAAVTAANYVNASYQLFIRRQPTDGERSAWVENLRRGVARTALTQALARSDEWAGVMIDDLYVDVFGRPADPGGKAYWLGRMRAGLRFEAVAANFYGSVEYFQRSGSTNAGLVAALYSDILGRTPDAAGLAYWSGLLDQGRATPGGVSSGFFASIESRQDRVRRVYLSVLGRDPDASGGAHWAQALLSVDDVSLAALLAASDEFYGRAQG